jgi:hypothetical protein
VTAPSPVLPSFTDGTLVHQGDLNALAQNLTNLYNHNQGGFRTQRPCVIAQTTTGQTINTGKDTILTFQQALVNTDNMWIPSVTDRITVRTAGIYWIFSQGRWPTFSSGFVSTSTLVNGTSVTNAVATQLIPCAASGSGPSTQNGVLINLAAGATVYLNGWQNSGADQTMRTDFGGTFLGAIFLTPSS